MTEELNYGNIYVMKWTGNELWEIKCKKSLNISTKVEKHCFGR